MVPLPTSITTTQPEPAQEKTLTWSVHLIRRQPQQRLRLALILIGVFGLSLCLFHSFWLALMPAAALLLSLSEFVFPVRYTLTPQSAAARHGLTLLEIRWTDVRHAYLTEEGVKLSPLRSKNARFEALRGILLRFDGGNQEAVIAAVQRFRQENSDHA